MAEQKMIVDGLPVTEDAQLVQEPVQVAELPPADAQPAPLPADTDEQEAKAPRLDPHKMVTVYVKETGEALPGKVPETWTDGRFPTLTATPKEGN